MKRTILLLVLPLFLALEANALPLPAGSTAPDFTLTDLNGVTHNLYSYLDQGYTVVIDFSATWCGPCWNYHNTHILADLWNQKGPPGTDEVMVFFIEGDPSTPVSALYGGAGSQGNWVDGTPYPIMDDGTGQVRNAYQITYFPTLYAVCPDKKIYEPGQVGLQTWINWIGSCSLDATAQVENSDCFGQPGGSIDLTATGGYGNLSYLWSNGSNTQDVSNLLPGAYSVTVTEGNGRTVSLQNLIVSSPTPIVPQTQNVSHVTCAGASNGSATVTASGGTPGYSYSWSNGASGSTANNLPGGVYQVTVSDANNCTKVHTVIVNEPAPLNGIPQVTHANCGNSDGAIILTPSGGTFPYSFNIGNGPQPTPVFLDLAAGSYTITITDAQNCFLPLNVQVNDLPGPAADAGPAQAIDCVNPVVALDGSNSGSGANVVYQWTTPDGNIVSGANTRTPDVDMPGTYIIEVLDEATGCLNTDQVVVTENIVLPTAEAGPAAEVDCVLTEVSLDGSASSEGTEMAYLWSTPNGNIVSGESTLSPLVDAGGTYILEVTNTANNCVATDTVEVAANQNAPVAEAGSNDVLNCLVSQIELNGAGSSSGPEFTYQWTGPGIVSGANTLTPTVNAPGQYVLEVTNTINGCLETDAAFVLEDLDVPIADAGPDGVLNCSTNSLVLDGTASSQGSGFVYLWTTPGGNIASGETTLSPTVDEAGTYVLQVTNTANGCIGTEEALVVEIPSVEGAAEEISGVSCSGGQNGSATVTASQGAAPYEFAWPGGFTGPTRNNLQAGTYTVTVTDDDNCTDLITVVVGEPDPLTANASATGETSLGNNDGTATASPVGGTGPYTYAWSNGETTETITGLTPGDYTVTITDENGCTTQETVTVNTFSCAISASVAAENISCNGAADGLATVQINNGLEPYIIAWSNGQEGPTASDLTPGSYTVSITDENNCPTTANVTIVEPQAVALTIIEVQDALCFGEASGQATVEGAGGVGGYSYSWPSGGTEPTELNLTGGTYIVTLTDGNGCETTTTVEVDEPQALNGNITASGETSYQSQNGQLSVAASGGNPAYGYAWSNGGTTAAISDLAPGEYTVTITDENGCVLELTGVVNEYICPEVNVESDVQGVSCNGKADGGVSLSSSGGTAPYNYDWSTGDTGPAVSGLPAGVYEVSIQDGANCPYSFTVEVTEPEVLALEIAEQVNIECTGQTNGSATVAGLGGTPGYIYAWSTGATEATASDLASGFHQVTVTDDNGCKAELELEIVVADDTTPPTVLTQDITLALDENGQTDLTPEMIDNGSFDNCDIESRTISQTVFDCSNLGPQEITLTVLDVNGNESTAAAIVTIVDETAPVVACPENVEVYNCDGLVEYALPTATDNCGETSVELADGLGSGSYFPIGSSTETYKATDASGNAAECSFTVTVVNTLESNVSASETCPDASGGSATIEVSGGTPGYTYLWSNGADTPSVEGLEAGVYEVTVFDATGCELTETVDVEAYPAIELDNIEVTAAQNGEANGSINITVSGGTPPFTYVWVDQEGFERDTEDIQNLPPDTYTLTITDANGCVFVSDPIEVENISSTSEPAWAGGVWLYPNPARDQVNVRIQLDAAAAVQLQVLDLKGVQMAIAQTNALANHDLQVASGQWPSGVYYIRLIIDEEVLVRRVVVE